MQEYLMRHFNQEDLKGFLGNVSLILIDKTDGKDPKKRELWSSMFLLELMLRKVSILSNTAQ